jgi:predicted TIM-barrel fold metal-dependent hydrolase
VLEPALPIFDPHHHFWEMPQRGRYLLHEFLADLAAGHNVVQTVFMECDAKYSAFGPQEMRPVGEVAFVRGIAAMRASGGYGPTKIAAGMVGFAELTMGARIREVLEGEIEAGAGLLRGLRYIMPWDKHDQVVRYVVRHIPPGLLLDPTFREGFAQLAPLRLSFDFWMYHTQLLDIVDLARAFSDTAIVVNHVGGALVVPYAGHRADVLREWKRNIQQIAACPNVRIKLGGLGLPHFGFDFHLRDKPPNSADVAEAWRPYIEICIGAFGPQRGMFESNFPPDKQSCSYLVLWNAFKRITAGASADEKAAQYAGTAADVYRL